MLITSSARFARVEGRARVYSAVTLLQPLSGRLHDEKSRRKLQNVREDSSANIFDKTGVSTRLELALFAVHHALVKFDR